MTEYERKYDVKVPDERNARKLGDWFGAWVWGKEIPRNARLRIVVPKPWLSQVLSHFIIWGNLATMGTLVAAGTWSGWLFGPVDCIDGWCKTVYPPWWVLILTLSVALAIIIVGVSLAIVAAHRYFKSRAEQKVR